MKDGEWSVIRCVGPQEEPMWSVVHRRKPMFVAVVSDESVDRLEAIPEGAIHWAKQGRSEASLSLLREALDAIRSCRRGSRAAVGKADPCLSLGSRAIDQFGKAAPSK